MGSDGTNLASLDPTGTIMDIFSKSDHLWQSEDPKI